MRDYKTKVGKKGEKKDSVQNKITNRVEYVHPIRKDAILSLSSTLGVQKYQIKQFYCLLKHIRETINKEFKLPTWQQEFYLLPNTEEKKLATQQKPKELKSPTA